MPRRNRRNRRKPREVSSTTVARRPTTQQMAADLVSRGLASPQILGPTPFNRPASNLSAPRERHPVRVMANTGSEGRERGLSCPAQTDLRGVDTTT